MKREFADGAKTPRDYIRMRLLWEAHREWLTQKEARGLIDGFSEQAAYILEDPLGYLDDFAELDDFEEALELFGVPYNDDEVYEARDALQEQLNQAEPDDPYDYEEPEDRPLRADRSEIQEIETLFARLEE
jgi:hypothetical protein